MILKGNLNEDIEEMLQRLDEVEKAGKYRPERVRGL